MEDPLSGLEVLGWDGLLLEDMVLQGTSGEDPHWDIGTSLPSPTSLGPSQAQSLSQQHQQAGLDPTADQSTCLSLAELESAGSTPKACLAFESPRQDAAAPQSVAHLEGLIVSEAGVPVRDSSMTSHIATLGLPSAPASSTRPFIRNAFLPEEAESLLSRQIADFVAGVQAQERQHASLPSTGPLSSAPLPCPTQTAPEAPPPSLWPFPFAYKQHLPFCEPLSPSSGLSSGSSSTFLSDFLSKSYFPQPLHNPAQTSRPRSPRIMAAPAGASRPGFSTQNSINHALHTSLRPSADAALAPGSGHHAQHIPVPAPMDALPTSPTQLPGFTVGLGVLDDAPLSSPFDWPHPGLSLGLPGESALEPPFPGDWEHSPLADAGARPLHSTTSLPSLANDIASLTSGLGQAGGILRSQSVAPAPTSGSMQLSFPTTPPQSAQATRIASGANAGPRHSSRQHTAPKWVTDSESLDSLEELPTPRREAKRSSGTLKAPHCNTKAGRKRLAVEHISLELLQQEGYFDMPIQEAAMKLKVGLSVLKRICRQMGLARWPFRTRQSLRGVIAKTREYYRGEESGEGVHKADVVQALESTLEQLQGVPGQGLSESVRKYRQSVFKLNYKIKKHKSGGAVRDLIPAATSGPMPVIPATAAARVAVPNAPNTPSGGSLTQGSGDLTNQISEEGPMQMACGTPGSTGMEQVAGSTADSMLTQPSGREPAEEAAARAADGMLVSESDMEHQGDVLSGQGGVGGESKVDRSAGARGVQSEMPGP